MTACPTVLRIIPARTANKTFHPKLGERGSRNKNIKFGRETTKVTQKNTTKLGPRISQARLKTLPMRKLAPRSTVTSVIESPRTFYDRKLRRPVKRGHMRLSI